MNRKKKPSNGLESPFDIDREIFNKDDQRTEDLHLQLSEKYMVYKELADRCIINPTQIDKGDNRVFYLKPDTIFMKEPRIQNQFRNEFIRQVQAPPTPEPFTMMADDIYKALIDEVRDKSNANMVRDQMNKFFHRRQYKLQHKKHKQLSRWSHFALTSALVDKVSLSFAPNLAKIQFELDQAVKRHQRLDGEDHFDSKNRPQRIEPNGQINPEDLDTDIREKKHCSLRVDDIDIYTRIVGYESACNAPVEKFINRAKWVPIQHRFDVYSQSQERLQLLRKNQIETQKIWQKRIDAKGMQLIELRKIGERGYKELQQIKNTLQFVKQEKQARTQKEILIQTATFSHELPKLITWNQLELKLSLEDLCKEYKIVGDMELDDGNSFSYAVAIQFPQIFGEQIIKTQFAPYDSTPQLLNPNEIGRPDILEVMKENIKKYGRSDQGGTLIEQLEIEKQSQRLDIQYINQIEQALFGQFNNGQLDDFPKVRLRVSHWLPYVCFKAEISKEQMQQTALLSGEQNPIDQVCANMLEIVNINEISNVNITLESLSQIHYDKLRSGKVRQELINLDRMDDENIFSENQKQFLAEFIDCLKLKADFGLNQRGIQDEAELPKHSLYDTTQHLLFAQYLMVCLKSRQEKAKLLYTLNAFRSIQKRIALELREFATRDRISFDVQQVEPKEQEKASLFETKKTETLDDIRKPVGRQGEAMLNVQNVVLDELIDINRYRFNGLTQTQMWSTCPVLPKFHITFGEPITRQEVSTEFEVNRGADPRKEMSQRLLGRIDFLSEHEPSGFILVTDDYGINLMYDATFADMRTLEQEMLKIMSYYINKLEPMHDTDQRNIFPIIDRFNLVKEIIICEEKYQRAKLNLAFSYLECFEHTIDTLEQQRIIQVIVDLMAKRPRINLAANHFLDSYAIETQVFETQTKLVKEFIKMQMDNEFIKNQEVRESLEKTYRLIYEQMDNKWQYFEAQDVKDEKEKRQLTAVGVSGEADMQKLKSLDKSKPGMFQAKQPTVDVNQFAEMLGMPISSLKMLMKEHNERDPLVKRSIHEHVSFMKLQEGYPIFISETEISKNNQVQLAPGGQLIGMLDLYESLSQITKLAAVTYHVVDELREVHQPDNGIVSALQNLVAIEFLLAELRAVKDELRGNQAMQSRDLDVIEDSSILGNAEKSLFFMKELIAAAEDPNLIQNPFVLTKIDLQTIKDVDFDQFQSSHFRKKGQLKTGTGQNNDPEQNDSHSEEESEDADDFTKKQKMHERNKDKGYPRLRQKFLRPSIPNLLEVCCSSVEVLRLRQTLVEAYHQRTILIKAYQSQCKLLGKESKIYFKDALNFETHLSGGESWKNFIDTGPGMETFVNTELSIKEFDPSLCAVLNFADPEAFKALVCPLGLEELRAVVRYELIHLHMLVIAVRHNQILLDCSQRQLAEIELFEKGFLVSAPAYDILKQLHGSNLHESSLKRISDMERRKILVHVADKVGKCSFMLLAKKLRSKDIVESQYKKIRQTVIDQKYEKVEIGLRYLRTSRIILCHDYCTDIQSQIYLDCTKMELLNEVNQIRKRAYLLPRDAMVHKIPISQFGEHTYAMYNEEQYQNESQAIMESEFWDPKKRQISNPWRIPSFWEIYSLNLDIEDFHKHNIPKIYSYNLDVNETEEQRKHNHIPFLLDANQKALIKRQLPVLSQFDYSDTEASFQKKGRLVDYQQAPNVQEQIVVKYLFYFRQLQNVFDLEFFRSKLSARANSISSLEQSVMSGLPFWESHTDPVKNQAYDSSEDENDSDSKPYSLQPDEVEFRNKLAEQVVQKMTHEKKLKIQLITELDEIKSTFKVWADRMLKLSMNFDITGSAIYLQDQVQLLFYSILTALQTVRENYAKDGVGQKEIQTINELLSLFSHTEETKVTYSNGFHVNHATTSMSRISLDDFSHRPDYNSFFMATLPVIDEQGLNPTEFNLIRGMSTPNATHLKSYRRLRPHLGWLPPRDFHYLDTKLLNLTKDQKKYIQANVSQFQEQSQSFAHAKLKVEPVNYLYNLGTTIEVLNEQKQFFRHQIKSQKLKNALIILMTKELLPNDVKKLQSLLKEFNEIFSWKIMTKSDEIEKNRKTSIQNVAEKSIVKQIQEQMQPQQRKKENIHPLITLFDVISCEIDVYQREIQKFMIITSKRLIERETTSLAKAFELNGKRMEVLIGVHQQFAATCDTAEDKRNHLDIINKVSPVQKMLTQMKNRMLVQKNYTGGEGCTIRTKELSNLLEEFCRSIVMNGEIEMRTRCEELSYQIQQYQDLMYAKDQQIFMLEHKLRHAKDELQKIVNTKVFAKGNTLIYDLDHTMRQLRLVKDNIYTMEGKLKDKTKLSFEKDLERARLELAESKKKFNEYQTTLNSHVKADIQQNIQNIEVELKRLINDREKPLMTANQEKSKEQLMDEYSHLLQGDAKRDYKEAQHLGVSTFPTNSVLNSKDLEKMLRQFEIFKQSEKEAREQVLEMQNLMRKQRMLWNFKWLIAQRKSDQKIDNLKHQLSSNAALWEQLAESEKRERILKQELESLQAQIQTQARVIDRFKDDTKVATMQNKKLTEYISENEKKLKFLQNRTKDIEIYDDINIPRMVQVVENKQRKIEELERNQKLKFVGLDRTIKQLSAREKIANEKHASESKIKLEALNALNELRQRQQNPTNSSQINDFYQQNQAQNTIDTLMQDNQRLQNILSDYNGTNESKQIITVPSQTFLNSTDEEKIRQAIKFSYEFNEVNQMRPIGSQTQLPSLLHLPQAGKQQKISNISHQQSSRSLARDANQLEYKALIDTQIISDRHLKQHPQYDKIPVKGLFNSERHPLLQNSDATQMKLRLQNEKNLHRKNLLRTPEPSRLLNYQNSTVQITRKALPQNHSQQKMHLNQINPYNTTIDGQSQSGVKITQNLFADLMNIGDEEPLDQQFKDINQKSLL